MSLAVDLATVDHVGLPAIGLTKNLVYRHAVDFTVVLLDLQAVRLTVGLENSAAVGLAMVLVGMPAVDLVAVDLAS